MSAGLPVGGVPGVVPQGFDKEMSPEQGEINEGAPGHWIVLTNGGPCVTPKTPPVTSPAAYPGER